MNRPDWLTLGKLKKTDSDGNAEYYPFVLPAAIVLAGLGVFVLFLVLRPVPPRVGVEKVAALVHVQKLLAEDVRSAVSGFGTVRARKTVQVFPQVSGKIQKIDDRLLPGARFKKGDLLFAIEPTDYELAVKMKESALATAKFQHQLELGNQVVAKREYELLEDDITVSELGEQLALRKPHLEEKEAALKAAESELAQAKLNLDRTKITAPFDAVVLSENVEFGQYVSPSTSALTLAATDEFLIEVKLPRRELMYFQFNSSGEPVEKYTVRVLQRVGPGETLQWDGLVLRLLSNVDENGRMAGILVAVNDPLRSDDEHSPLLLGSYVEVQIEGRIQQQVFAVPERAVREGEVVWLMGPDGKLQRREVDVIFNKNEKSYLRGNITSGEQVITSNIPNALEGMLLKAQNGTETEKQ